MALLLYGGVSQQEITKYLRVGSVFTRHTLDSIYSLHIYCTLCLGIIKIDHTVLSVPTCT